MFGVIVGIAVTKRIQFKLYFRLTRGPIAVKKKERKKTRHTRYKTKTTGLLSIFLRA